MLHLKIRNHWTEEACRGKEAGRSLGGLLSQSDKKSLETSLVQDLKSLPERGF